MKLVFPIRKGLVAFTLAAAVTVAALPATAQGLRFVTSNTGGSFYPIGVAISQILSQNGIETAAEPGGGNSNPVSVSQGKADLGFTFAPTFALAMAGEKPFPAPLKNIRALAYTHVNTTQIAVTKESGVTSIDQLKGKPFASQNLSAASATFFRVALGAYGLTEDNLNIVVRGGPTQGANAVRDRNSIGFQATTSIPNGTFSEAFQSVEMTLLPISDEAFASIVADYPTFSRATIPGGTYSGLDADVPSMSTGAVIIVRDDMDEELAYKIAKTIADNSNKLQGMHGALGPLTPKLMASVSGIPLHPGAERFYKEASLR